MDTGFAFVDSKAIPWRQSTTAAGVDVKDLGTANGRSMELVRCQPGTAFPPHTHPGPEFVFVLEGEAVQSGQVLTPGWAAVAEAGSLDRNFHCPSSCLFLIVYSQ